MLLAPPLYKNAVLMHFNTRTAEEYINKINRGFLGKEFILGDNNILGTEKLSDVLQDYINNGTVDIIDHIGEGISQSGFYGEVYEKYKNKCKWISFFDFDEYLLMHFEEGKNISVQEFLSNEIYSKCESIEINWVLYDDNDLVYYDNRPSLERFTTKL